MSWELPEYALRKALFSRLDAAISYDGSTVPIIDAVDETSPFPAILLGDYEEAGVANKDAEETEAEIEIEVWSCALGSDEVAMVANSIHERLTSEALSLDDGWEESDAYRIRYTHRRFSNDEGEVYRVGVLSMLYSLGR